MQEERNTLITIQNVKQWFPYSKGFFSNKATKYVKAVDDVSFEIKEGETLGLVGESGCGKSTLGRTILQLYKPTSGRVYYKDQDLTAMNKNELRNIRKDIQIIHQNPYSSLDPKMTIRQILMEPLSVHNYGTKKDCEDHIHELLSMVGLPQESANRKPANFSGGQRQRIGIARALAVSPSFIVCDEPISALDVSIRAQIINLLEEVQEKLNLTYLFIAHDLAIVKKISDRIAVMYMGKIVELSNWQEIYDNPLHPYTKALLSAIPIPNPRLERNRKRIILEGDIPNPINPPSGCAFRTRCKNCTSVCSEKAPEYRCIGNDHWVACHNV